MHYFTSDLHLGHANIIKYCRRPFQNSTESMLIDLAYKGIIPLEELSISIDSVEKMDTQIVSSINSVVEKNDQLVILGDFCFGGSQYKEKMVQKYVDLINCKNITLILGNHDEKDIMTKYFKNVYDYCVFNIYGKNIVTCHYPMRSWYKQNKSSWMLYGHTHGLLHKKDTELLSQEEEENLNSVLKEFFQDKQIDTLAIIDKYKKSLKPKFTLDVGVDNPVRKNIDFGKPWSFKEIQTYMNKINVI